MFIGHYAVALAAKKQAPQVSLGTLFAASVALDLLWPVFLLAGIEHAEINPGDTASTTIAFTDYPYSHSLLMVLIWAAVFGFLYLKKSGNKTAAKWIAGLVVSHWLLDLITHRADLPLFPGGPMVGMGLWNLKLVTLIFELGIFVYAFSIYKRLTHAKNPFGRFGLWGLALFLIILQFANFFGPPPPNIHAVAVAGNLQWLFVIFAFWIDQHRLITQKKTPAGTIVAAT